MATFPYHASTPAGPGFHTHETCPVGARIPRAERVPGRSSLDQCGVCATLDELQAAAARDRISLGIAGGRLRLA